MSDQSKEIVPTSVLKSTGEHLTAAELLKIDRVPPQMMPDGTRVIYVKVEEDRAPESRYRGDDLLRRFLPYFVISTMGLILLGGVVALLGLIIPVILGAIVAIIGSIVSIIMSIVATIFAGAIIAMAITFCQKINAENDHE